MCVCLGEGGAGADRCVISPPVSRKTNVCPLSIRLTHIYPFLSPLLSLYLPCSIKNAYSRETALPRDGPCTLTIALDYDSQKKFRTVQHTISTSFRRAKPSRFSFFFFLEINLGTTDELREKRDAELFSCTIFTCLNIRAFHPYILQQNLL